MANLKKEIIQLLSDTSEQCGDTYEKRCVFDYDFENVADSIIKLVNGNKDDKSEEDTKEVFEVFRKSYPGTKRGFKTEYENFKKKNKKDYKQIVHLLLPAITKFIEYKNKCKAIGMFCPEYANLQTWINQKRWESEFRKITNVNSNGTENITDKVFKEF